jgi:hypothetical protein
MNPVMSSASFSVSSWSYSEWRDVTKFFKSLSDSASRLDFLYRLFTRTAVAVAMIWRRKILIRMISRCELSGEGGDAGRMKVSKDLFPLWDSHNPATCSGDLH